MLVDLCDWISAELHYYCYLSECSYAVRRSRIVMMLAKACSGLRHIYGCNGLGT